MSSTCLQSFVTHLVELIKLSNLLLLKILVQKQKFDLQCKQTCLESGNALLIIGDFVFFLKSLGIALISFQKIVNTCNFFKLHLPREV